jgi:hypothetical protein
MGGAGHPGFIVLGGAILIGMVLGAVWLAADHTVGMDTRSRARPAEEQSTGAVPSTRLIEVLEAAVTRFPYIGSVDGWWRRWRFPRKNPRSEEVSLTTIEFHFDRAGNFGIRPGRHITPPVPIDTFEIDDSPIVASGTYDMRTRVLRLTYCGSNFPSQPKVG